MKKKLAIFDLDGVITSTTDEHFHAWTMLFKTYFDVRLDPSYEVYTKGVSRMESLNILLEKTGIHIDDAHMLEKMAQEKNKMYQRLISNFDKDKILPGMDQLLKFLKKEGLKIALGSASKNGPFLLEKLKLIDQFDYMVDPTELESKPAPDIFLEAMHHFGYIPDECIAFEDAVAGIKAIKNAKMFAIGVGSENLIEADWHIESLEHMNYQKLKELIHGSYEGCKTE